MKRLIRASSASNILSEARGIAEKLLGRDYVGYMSNGATRFRIMQPDVGGLYVTSPDGIELNAIWESGELAMIGGVAEFEDLIRRLLDTRRDMARYDD